MTVLEQRPADVSVPDRVAAIEIATDWLVERRSRLLEKDWLTADQLADLRFMYERDVEALCDLAGGG